MDIKAALVEEHSKARTLLIANHIGDNPTLFAQLMTLFLANEYRVTQRAAWAVSVCAESHPELIAPHLEAMIDNLQNQVHDAVKRNTIRIVLHLKEIPENLYGKLASICFDLLASPTEAIAIRVFAMRVLARICEKEPDLKEELKLTVEEGMLHSTPAYKAAAKDILKKIRLNLN